MEQENIDELAQRCEIWGHNWNETSYQREGFVFGAQHIWMRKKCCVCLEIDVKYWIEAASELKWREVLGNIYYEY